VLNAVQDGDASKAEDSCSSAGECSDFPRLLEPVYGRLDDCNRYDLRTQVTTANTHQGLTATRHVDFEELWSVLASSLREIHTKNASTLSFEELYRNAYRMVLMTREEELYDRVKQLEQDWLCDEVQKRVTAAISPSLVIAREPTDAQDQSSERRAAGERFLAVLKEAWEDHQLCMGMITDVLMYMVCPSRILQVG
jgi:hypothetical protein